MIELTHKILKLKTDLTVRRSILHKVRNYLIVLPDQPDLEKALVLLGILDRSGSLVQGVPRHVANRACCRRAFVRGSLIAGGFVADPKGDFHLEIAVQGEQFAHDLASLIAGMGVKARVNPRRGAYAVYIKSAEDIKRLLSRLGAERAVSEIEDARAVKSVKNEVNRRVNAELANQTRSAGAAQRQLELIEALEKLGCGAACPRDSRPFARCASPIQTCLSEIWGSLRIRRFRNRPCTIASCASRRWWRRRTRAPPNRDPLLEGSWRGRKIRSDMMKRFNRRDLFESSQSRE